jgi:hypothetical protein
LYSLIDLVKGIKEVKDDARNEASELKDMIRQMKDSKDDDRKEASELKEMMRQLMNNNNSNNNRSNPRSQQTVHGQQQVVYGRTGTRQNVVNKITPPITGTETTKEKRKHDGTTPSSSPKEKKISPPDHRKQRHHSNELEIDPPNSTVLIKIDFGMYTNDIDMGNMDDTTTTLMRNGEDNNNDTEMGQVEETNNNASQWIGYIGSSGSFCSRNTNSDGTATVIKEEQSITGHNSDNVVDVMDYTTRTAARTIRTTTQLSKMDPQIEVQSEKDVNLV